MGPQLIAVPQDEHHPASSEVPTADVGPWPAGEFDAAGESLLPRYQGDRHLTYLHNGKLDYLARMLSWNHVT